MRIALLGAGGFIGSNLVEHLLDRDEHDIVGIDLSDEKVAEFVGRPRFEFITGNIHGDLDLTDQLIRDSDVVVDLVAYANPSVYVSDPLEVFEVNFLLNLEVIRSCVRHGRRLIQYSTAEVYGKPSAGQESYSEDLSDMTYGPYDKQRWIYASGKQLLERVIHAYGLQGDLEYTIVRPFNFVGPRADYLVPPRTMGGPRVFAHFMSALLSGGPMYLVNGGHSRRTFTHIQDANEAFQTVLDHPAALGQAFNFGNPNNDITIKDLAALMKELFAELTGVEPTSDTEVVTGEQFYGEGYEDNGRVVPDVSKLGALGWQPTRGLRDTFRHAMQYYLDNPQEMQSPDLVERRRALALQQAAVGVGGAGA